jgi:hypothetical protein
MENITSDFRKWVAYNNELNSRETIRSLFESLRTVGPSGSIQFNTLAEGGETYYVLRCGDSHILKLEETQRLDFLHYISEHYLNSEIPEKEPLPETTTQQIPGDNNKPWAMLTSSSESRNAAWITWIANKLACENTFVQAFRFSLAGILIFQLIVVPEYVLDIDISKNAIVVFALIVLGVLSHTSVRLYRKHFTADDRVRYRFVWRLVMLFCVLLYVEFNTEVTLLELAKGTSSPTLVTLLVFVPYLVFGAFIGLFFSGIAYFTNGGKVMSQPGEA